MRFLVTGVSGLLGLNLAWLTSQQHAVTGVLRGTRAVPAPDRTPFPVIQADLTKAGVIESVLDTVQPDVVIHCAAMTEVDRCEMYPEEAYRTNALLPQMLARAASCRGTRLLHISTDAVFDGSTGDYSEEDATNPINTYGRTKLDGERAVLEAFPAALVARVNFYGWSWQGARSLAEFFFNNLASGTAFFGYDDVIFCPLLANDMVEIFMHMLDRDLTGVYHVVSAEALSKYEFARLLAREFGFDESLITPASCKNGNLRAPRSLHSTLRSDKLAAALGEALPTQAPAMHRFANLYRQGYPQLLRSMFAEPDHSLAR